MITLRPDPGLVDLLTISAELRECEREQLEALMGTPFNYEQLAASCYGFAGPKWLFVNGDGTPVAALGFVNERLGVFNAWMIATDLAWKQPLTMTKLCRLLFRHMFDATDVRRIQHASLAAHTATHSWYRSLGLAFEGKMCRWGAKGEDALMFACTEKP